MDLSKPLSDVLNHDPKKAFCDKNNDKNDIFFELSQLSQLDKEDKKTFLQMAINLGSPNAQLHLAKQARDKGDTHTYKHHLSIAANKGCSEACYEIKNLEKLEALENKLITHVTKAIFTERERDQKLKDKSSLSVRLDSLKSDRAYQNNKKIISVPDDKWVTYDKKIGEILTQKIYLTIGDHCVEKEFEIDSKEWDKLSNDLDSLKLKTLLYYFVNSSVEVVNVKREKLYGIYSSNFIYDLTLDGIFFKRKCSCDISDVDEPGCYFTCWASIWEEHGFFKDKYEKKYHERLESLEDIYCNVPDNEGLDYIYDKVDPGYKNMWDTQKKCLRIKYDLTGKYHILDYLLLGNDNLKCMEVIHDALKEKDINTSITVKEIKRSDKTEPHTYFKENKVQKEDLKVVDQIKEIDRKISHIENNQTSCVSKLRSLENSCRESFTQASEMYKKLTSIPRSSESLEKVKSEVRRQINREINSSSEAERCVQKFFGTLN